MKEPIRWLDDPQTSAALREVLNSAPSAPGLPASTHARMTLLASGLTSQAAAASKAAVAFKSVSSFLGFHGAGKAIAVAAMMAAIGTGSYVGVRYVVTRSAVNQSEAHRAATVRVMPSSVAPAAASEIAPLPAIAAEAAASNEPAKGAPATGVSHKAESRTDSEAAGLDVSKNRGSGSFEELSIADEARLLEQARAQLAVNPAQALEIANAHQRLYPAGQLSAEREFIAVDALMRLGRRSEAQHRAEPRLNQAPNSLYARRLRKLLEN